MVAISEFTKRGSLALTYRKVSNFFDLVSMQVLPVSPTKLDPHQRGVVANAPLGLNIV